MWEIMCPHVVFNIKPSVTDFTLIRFLSSMYSQMIFQIPLPWESLLTNEAYVFLGIRWTFLLLGFHHGRTWKEKTTNKQQYKQHNSGLSNTLHGQIQRGAGGPDPPWKIKKNIVFPSNTGPDPLKMTRLPSQHSMLGHHRHVRESHFNVV